MKGSAEIKNENIFTTIRDINEVLSLSNETQKLLNMTLDTVAEALDTECCWVQTINGRQNSLQLAADRGFTPEMRREISSMNLNHRLSEHVIGMGSEITIPDLYNDGRFDLSSFRNAGYKWLVAAPLMTYRVDGLLGIASRDKKQLRKETPELVTVIAGLIGTAMNKIRLSQHPLSPVNPEPSIDKKSHPSPLSPFEAPPTSSTLPVSSVTPSEEHTDQPADSAFQQHIQHMKSFRHQHP